MDVFHQRPKNHDQRKPFILWRCQKIYLHWPLIIKKDFQPIKADGLPATLAESFGVFGNFNVAYFNNNLNRLQVGLCECGNRPWQKKLCSDDRLYFQFLQYSLRLSHDSDNFKLYVPSHVSHFFFLPDFRRFWEILGDFGSHVTSLNQGPFSLQRVRKRTMS